ncbi:MAG: carboxypeptidase-like regulatory domain-containing protein [Polyangiaceae bacterium]
MASVLISSASGASGAPVEPQLRVTGTLTIEASASQLPNASEVDARLLDDAGHPVSSVDLVIKPLNVSTPLAARDCHSHTVQLIANADGSYLARSNGSGALCVHFDGTAERAEFELSFSDPNGLYGAVTRHVVADSATRNVEMAFAPTPSVLALERETQIISLLTRPMPALAVGEPVEILSVSLNLKREGQAPRPLSASNVEIGGTLEFRVPSGAFGPPGPIEISAQFPGSVGTRAARTIAHATITAQVVLALADPVPPSHPESGVRLRVRAASIAGPVPNGSVEARSAGASLGSARVKDGFAELYLQMEESAAKAYPVELRYVPDSPWWLPASTVSVAVPVAPPSPWQRIAWVATVTVLGAWLLLGWRRPRRRERVANSPVQRHAARVPVDVLEVGDVHSGWRGRVLDAHDGSPIAGALVLVRLPAFDASGVVRTTRTDEAGAFTLEGTDLAGPMAALEVRAPFHTPLAARMPPPGTLVLSLTSRRRTLLRRFVEWAVVDGGWERRGEATPGEVARRTDRTEVANWAGAVDEAAFGPEPLSEAKEQGVIGREPGHHRKPPVNGERE